MDKNTYDVVMFPITRALAVCDLNIQDTDSEKVYAFSVKRKLMRMFDLSIWNSAVKITNERAFHAINQYLNWSKTEGLKDDDYQKRCKTAINRKKVIEDSFKQKRIFSLWHMAHRDNIKSILERGILNHDDAQRFKPVNISNPEVIKWRKKVEEHYHRKVLDYALLYIKPKNPMLSAKRDLQDELCLVEVSLSVMFNSEYLITDGNAASGTTQFFNSVNDIEALPWDVLNGKSWKDSDDGKRKMCAEVLIYPKVTPKHIKSIHCYSQNTLNALDNCGCKVELSRNLFF